MWLDYLTVLRNAQTTAQYGLGYVLGEWPLGLALWVVYLGRKRE